MIPKTIHYCWFGKNPKPELVLKCLASWRKFAPDYKIIELNEDNIIEISDSGNSKKFINVENTKKRNNKVIGLTRYNGGKLKKSSDISLHVPVNNI